MNAISKVEFKHPSWQTATLFALGFWLSASLVLDWVIMPSLYLSGMMLQEGFTTAGYAIFWIFNRLELLSAAVVLTGILVWSKTHTQGKVNMTVIAVMLLAIALLNTYFFTPQMSAIGVNLNLFATESAIPATMNLLHGGYFILEVVKLLVGGVLFNWCWQQQS
ncbi:conserved hypothetical protein [Trichormus variabilis ATCC 29413]|uniref:DUF4149 domain-containing protein n=2 Tax=Anabaena variabilis TaxID=264691 RepID=Q3MDR7_TRIV2|nr:MULTISPECIES: hypothetical protein [Nostocaceae]ABA20869.1 conserved hypothetical protein [Trichormus variabilis ATCC 29413]MBC1217335.1 hypothetical protein [Trichormus variabilis ARAD]MBC1257726.1 hypothetical protein [Trichormus variabilis V5]MBC1270126.1 hypothetical protein [Trichormus variabilis FSR]MBC1305231.1 hypothetical protein [Trichormus variabilis N2B]